MGKGALHGGLIGPSGHARSTLISPTTYIMAALNAGIAFRFVAQRTTDITAVTIRWGTVTTTPLSGVVKLQIETVDANGKPTGTPYDSNATISFTPVVGVQTYTFATAPTFGLTVGTDYCITLLTTTAGTTQTLSAYDSQNSQYSIYPTIALTSATGQTPSSYAAVSQSVPICMLTMSDASFENYGMNPYAFLASSSSNEIYSTTQVGMKVVTSTTIKVIGIEIGYIKVIGTPAGNINYKIVDGSNNTISGTSGVILIADIPNSGRAARVLFISAVTLPAGTYIIVMSSPNSGGLSNCWAPGSAQFFNSGVVSTNFRLTKSSDSGTTWTDSTTDDMGLWLIIDDIPAGSGNSGPWGMIR